MTGDPQPIATPRMLMTQVSILFSGGTQSLRHEQTSSWFSDPSFAL
ncbi:MAG TPA: hypothetical protein VFN67_32145 [Polyangiales bacterium]|nr:hypothetical protein [Polyangiales bacterium]